MKARQYNNTLEQARNYAAADRSDPFTFNRILAHISNGLCDNRDGTEDCRYKAEAVLETRRLPPSVGRSEGAEFQVTVYRNAQRP